MVAVPEGRPTVPAVGQVGPAPSPVPARDRRFVALAVDATELLRPASDLVRLVEGARYVDVLLARELEPVGAPAPLGILAGAEPPATGPAAPEDDEDETGHAALLADIGRLGVPELYVHRLGLPAVTGPGAEADLVAGLSELVGFDPEPGVYLLGPTGGGAGRAALRRAVERVAQVYGIPVLRYRCLELTVVTPSG